MSTEEHRVVIGVDYMGAGDISRFLNDLEKLGPTAERQMQRMAQAFRSGQGQLDLSGGGSRGPLGLPAGGGQAREIQAAQSEFVRGLRERIAADRAAAQAAREYARSVRFQDKVGSIAESRGAALSFGPGGNPELAFSVGSTDVAAKQRELSTRLSRLTSLIAGVEAQYANASRTLIAQINKQTAELNRQAITARLSQAVGGQDTVGGDLQAELLRNIVSSMQPSNAAGKALLYEGRATKGFIDSLAPEQRQLLLGSPERGAVYGSKGTRIPETTTVEAQLGELRDQASAELRARRAMVQAELSALTDVRALQRSAREARQAAISAAAPVPHPTLFGRGANAMPEFERALAAIQARAAGEEAARQANLPVLAGSRTSALVPSALFGQGANAMPEFQRALRAVTAAADADAAALRQHTSSVNMDRNAPLKGNLRVDPDMAYRMIGESGLNDLLSTGQLRARPGGKYEAPYFGETPLARYGARRGTYDYVAGVPRSALDRSPSGDFFLPKGGASSIPADQASIFRVNRQTGEAEQIQLTAALRHRAAAEESAARAAEGGGNGRSGGGRGTPPPPPPGGPGGPSDEANNQQRRNKGTRDWFAANEALIDATRGETASSVMKAKANLKAAEISLDQMIAKGDKGIGVKGGFATEDARLKAQSQATSRLQSAYAGLEQAILREKEAERKAAAAAERRAAPNDLGIQHGPGMPITQQTINAANGALLNGGAITPVQIAQQQAAQAQAQLAAATKSHTAVMNGQYHTQQQAGQAYATSLGNLTQAQRNAQQAQQRLTQLQQSAAANAQPGGFGGFGGGGGRGGNFFSAFGAGFRGNPDVPVATQLGQTARFSVFYGTMYKALFAITETFHQALQEGIQFEDAMTNLVIAAGKPRAELEDLAKTLGEQSVRAGFAPSQGIEIGARSLGLYGASEAPIDTQRQVAEISSRVVSQVAVGSKKTPVELQGDIAAIAQALGLGASGQQRIADLDAYFTKRFGVQQGSTFETVAQSASVGKAAGFSDEQIFAIAADMISRTGQTPSAVAGFMAQIFSRGGEGSLVDVAAKQGIDPNQDLAKIVGQLAEIYRTADPRSQAQISAAFGRGKVQNAAVALLSDFPEVQDASTAGVTKSAGAANKQFELHMANIGGQLRELGGMMRLFAQELGQAGLLDAIGAGVIVLKDLVQAGNVLLGLWNEMPRGIRSVIAGLGLLTLALRTSAAGSLLNRAAVAGGLIRAAGPVTSAGALAPLVTSTGAAATGFQAAGAVGKGLLRMIGPIGFAIGGLLAIGSLKSSADRMGAAQQAATDVLAAGGLNPQTSTAADYRAQAAEVKAQADVNRQATGKFANFITFGAANNDNMATARQLDAEAKRLERVAAGIPESASAQAGSFRSLGASDVKSGLDALQASGATAQTQLTALRDVLYGTAGAAKAAADAFDPKKFAGRASGGLAAAALNGIKGGDLYGSVANASVKGRFGPGVPGASTPILGDEIRRRLAQGLTGSDIQGLLPGALDAAGVDSEADLNRHTATQVATVLSRTIDPAVFAGLSPEKVKQLRSQIIKSLRDQLLLDAQGVAAAVHGSSTLSGEDAAALANSIIQQSDAALGTMGETDTKGRIGELRQRIRDLRRTRGRTEDTNTQAGITAQIGEARKLLVENQLAELEAIRKTAYQNATTKAQITAAGQAALVAEISRIVKNGSADQLVNLIGQAGKSSITLARQAILDAIKIARASMVIGAEAAQLGQVINGQMQGMAAAFRGRGAEDANAGANREIQRLQKMLSAIAGATYGGGKNNKFSLKGIDVYNPKFNNGESADKAAEKDKPTAEEIAAERATAYATRSEGQVAAARAAIQTARAQLDKAKKGTIEYYQALGSLFSAQNALTDAIQAYQKNRMLLGVDMTNPLRLAEVESRAAAIKLKQDIAQGKAGDVLAQDRVDLRNAQANAESTRFSQRLQTVQTADQLGRISHQKYLNYLDNERKRLEAIKHRSFQQQQQLDQIDGLLKEATKTMQGQFNFGDIKLPTPYEVRRYVEQTAGAAINRAAGPTTAAGTHSTYLTLNVDGADTAKVTQIVQAVVGQSARTLTTAPRRK